MLFARALIGFMLFARALIDFTLFARALIDFTLFPGVAQAGDEAREALGRAHRHRTNLRGWP